MRASSFKQIYLHDWNQQARIHLAKVEYLKCAIAVATELTKHIVHANANLHDEFPLSSSRENQSGGQFSSLRPIEIEDISPENVLVSIPSKHHANDLSLPARFRAAEVIIQRGGAYVKVSKFDEVPQLSQADLCFALGKLFFDIFSEENSSVSLLTDPDLQGNQESTEDGYIGIGDTDLNEPIIFPYEYEAVGDNFEIPALKKMSINQPKTSTDSMKVKSSLQAQMLPLSICQLIADLMDAKKWNISLEVVLHELQQIESYPERYLHDVSCQKKALEMTGLFNHNDDKLFGRKKEKNTLLYMTSRVSLHLQSWQRNSSICRAAFISGQGGSGKSTLIKHIASYCEAKDWSVVFCKFESQVAPLTILIQSFDAYFGKFLPREVDGIILKREQSLQETFDQMSHSILLSIDNESFSLLCQLLPAFSQLFPIATKYAQQRNEQNGSVANKEDSSASSMNQADQFRDVSTMINIGSGRNRLLNLLQIILNVVRSGGKPVLICVDDLQWADEFAIGIITGYIIQTPEHNDSKNPAEKVKQQDGMILLGSFREDEVPENGFLMNKIKLMEQSHGSLDVATLVLGELTEQEINEMLSFKLCLTMWHTQELAELVYHKTRGHPLFIKAFLQSIIQANILSFSVKARRWTWDYTTIDLQMISNNVAEFLTKKLKQLSHDSIETLKVASCFGQVNLSTIQLLDHGQFVPSLLESIELVRKEGIIERAGPVFAFSHDILQESSYNLIPIDERKTLHKNIAMSLVQDPDVSENADICVLAVDQINHSRNLGGLLTPKESSLFARLNMVAGKHSMSSGKSNYKQAQGYFEAGISMLHANHWNEQYSLSLELYESSVVVSFIDGRVEVVGSRLDTILSNTRSFDDSVNSHVLQARFLASQENYSGATRGVLDILSSLGETFPKEINKSLVISEIDAITPILEMITKDKMLNLPAMTDRTKLQTMQFMDLLTNFTDWPSPMLKYIVSCRMTKLTLSSGFCGHSISGLVNMAQGLLYYSAMDNTIMLATQMSRIAESLMKENINVHALRAKLSCTISSIQGFVEPFQAALQKILDGYNSGKICGDVDNALNCGLLYSGSLVYGTADLGSAQKQLGYFMWQMYKHKRIGILHSSMSYFNVCTALIGNNDGIDVYIEMKTNEELYQLSEQSHNPYLMYQVLVNQMYIYCYFREYLPCAELAEIYQNANMENQSVITSAQYFYAGISALNLARGSSKQDKWKKIGEKAFQFVSRLTTYCTWNFENKKMLLQAELHYLNKKYMMAELAYQSSIVSAGEHKFIQEEAMAHELFGIYFMENGKTEKGIGQLELAYDTYKTWGALKKARTLKVYIDSFSASC